MSKFAHQSMVAVIDKGPGHLGLVFMAEKYWSGGRGGHRR